VSNSPKGVANTKKHQHPKNKEHRAQKEPKSTSEKWRKKATPQESDSELQISGKSEQKME
jgi:hypothetical protein